MALSALRRDRYALYEAAVQGVEHDLQFIERVYRRHNGRPPRLLREDFCATALLACEWVARGRDHHALALDLDPAPLAWVRRHRLPYMRAAADRLQLLKRDARSVTKPRSDVLVALNFSYWVFQTRAELIGYFRKTLASLTPGGMMFANAFGGTEAMEAISETRRIDASQGPDGGRIPGFTYVWEQQHFNPIDHHLISHIHFRFRDGTMMRRAFTYDWRLWTLPEIRDCMLEAGYRAVDIYAEGWDEAHHRPDHIYRRREKFENQLGWLAVIVGRTKR
jgi:hypothetical protein